MITQQAPTPMSPEVQTPVWAGIIGLGHALPPRVVTNSDLEKQVDTTDAWIRSRTGIEKRHIADLPQCSSHLGAEAGLQALEDAGLAPEQLDLIIVATVTPDTSMPCTACRIQQALGAQRAGAFDLSIACSGFVYALTVAEQYVVSGTVNNVLVIGVDTLSRITNWEDRSTCVLFGDAAGAAVVARVEEGTGLLGFHLGADGGGGELLKIPAPGGSMPGNRQSLSQADCSIQMDGPQVYRFAVEVMTRATERALEQAGLTIEDVDLLVPHQANLRILEGAAKRLGLQRDKVFVNVDRYGNTSSGSVPLALWEARQGGRIQPGDVVAATGFGGGLAWSSVVLRWASY